MWGTVYRMGMWIKDFGETIGWAWIQRIGIRMKDVAVRHITG